MLAKRLKRRKKRKDVFNLLKTILSEYPTDVLKDMKKKKKSKKNITIRADFRKELKKLKNKI
jgi:hypothetical protein